EATTSPVMLLIPAFLLMAALSYIVYFTRFGRAMRAVSYSFETASLMGIPTDRVVSIPFVIASPRALSLVRERLDARRRGRGPLRAQLWRDQPADGGDAGAEELRRRGPRRD